MVTLFVGCMGLQIVPTALYSETLFICGCFFKHKLTSPKAKVQKYLLSLEHFGLHINNIALIIVPHDTLHGSWGTSNDDVMLTDLMS